jgi:hypothetical protein
MPEKTLFIAGDNYQLRQAIFRATPKAVEQTRSIARQFKGETDNATALKIFNFLKNQINYQADGEHQKIKLPNALLRERVGDCKSYSLLTMGILTNLGIPAEYVLTSYNADPTPTHIYVKTKSGIIIDAVWGTFNSEKKANHVYTKSINGINPMKISYISGVRGVPQSVKTKTIGNCGCGCNDRKIGSVFIGELTSQEKADCLKKYPVKKTMLGDTNRLARESCYAAKGGLKETADTIKKVGLSIPRQIALGIFSLNFDGISTQLNNSSRMNNLIGAWKKIGGDEASLRAAIRDGSSKPVKKFGMLKAWEDAIRKRVKSKLGISGGMGGVTPAQNQQIKTLLMDDGATSVAYRSSLIAAIGGLGATMGAAVGSVLPVIGTAAGGTGGTAAGGYIGELLYQATPTLIDKLFPPGTPNRENPNPDEPDYNNGDDNDGDGGGSGTGTLLLVGGLAVGLFLILKKK